jgi:hypothetical protein
VSSMSTFAECLNVWARGSQRSIRRRRAKQRGGRDGRVFATGEQTADSRQQTADSRQQTADSRQQTAESVCTSLHLQGPPLPESSMGFTARM